MSSDPEKKHQVCEQDVVDVRESIPEISQGTRQAAERRLLRKLDSRFLPVLVIISLMNYADRAAITSARLQGLQTDLGLSDAQYDTVLAVFYASYCSAQVLSNVVLNYISKPALYIGTCSVIWGLTSALTGVTHNFSGIVTCRLFLGLPESSWYPGAIYLLSRWYTRKELALRIGIFYSGQFFSYAFGSLWAAGILAKMNGTMGIAGWRWLFYTEGTITILIGFLAMWLLPNYPHNTTWLTPAERRLAQVRLAEDAGEADMDSENAPFFEGLRLAVEDPKVWIFMFLYLSEVVGLSFVNFFPTLTATLGYSTTNTLLMAAPPWILSATVALINTRHADITGERFFHQTVWFWVIMLGYVISLSTMSIAGRYFSMYLMAAGDCVSTISIVWVANTIPRPPAKRATAIALVNGFGNLGSIAGSYIWKSKWGPKYHQSMIIALSALTVASILSFVMRTLLVWENKRMEREELDWMHGPERERIEEAAKLEGITFDEAVRLRKGFRYLY